MKRSSLDASSLETLPVLAALALHALAHGRWPFSAPLMLAVIALPILGLQLPKRTATFLAGGKLIVQHDNGQITLVDPSPDAYKELGKIQPLGGKCWTMPVVANGRLYARSTKEVVCLDVAN